MVEPWMVVLAITLVAYAWSFRKDRAKTVDALRKSANAAVTALPIFFLAVIFSGQINALMSGDDIERLYGVGSLGVVWATLLGFILPGPRYAIYPLANVFIENGASWGSVVTMISSQQLIDVPEGMFIEIKYLRMRFFLVRLLNAVVISLLAGILTNIAYYTVLPMLASLFGG